MSPRNNPARARCAGFTLIEVLVVVVIIAIIATTALLAVGTTGRDTQLEKESERVLALLKYAREQAELRTREYGLLCEEDRYQFVIFDSRKQLWVKLEADETLRQRELPIGLSLRLIVEARPVVLRRPPDTEDLTPQIMVYSNGDVTPFELAVERREERRSITVASTDDGLIEARPMQERAT